MGPSLFAMPWAFEQSGIVLGFIMTMLSCPIAFYTCKLVVMSAGDDGDYFELMRNHFGK